jgi:hypothetical protein
VPPIGPPRRYIHRRRQPRSGELVCFESLQQASGTNGRRACGRQDFGGNAGGSVAVISVCPDTGDVLAQTDWVLHEEPTDQKLLDDPRREDWTPHAHSANWSP